MSKSLSKQDSDGGIEGYVAECERKIKVLENRVTKLEHRLTATISIAAREATEVVLAQLRKAVQRNG